LKEYNFRVFIFLIVGKFFDILTTYISGNGSLSNEMNLLVRFFGLSWTALLWSEVIFIFVAYFLLKNQNDSFYKMEEEKINRDNLSFSNYLGFLYYGKKVTFLESLTAKVKLKVFFNSLIQLFFITTIIVSFVVSINNLLAGFNFFNLFSYRNKIYQDNIVNIINLFVFILSTIIYHYKKYKKHIFKFL
jgi:hypothetical protein